MATTAVSTQNKKSFKEWFTSRKVQRTLVIGTFMFIPLLLLIVFTYLPFAKMIEFSFFDMKYLGDREFVGIDNYVQVFEREDCFKAFKLCIYYILGAFVQLALALYFASLLTFKTTASGLFKGLIFFPYLICGIAVGFIFKFFYTRGFVLDTVLQWVGFDLDNLPYWLSNRSINNVSLAASSIWRYMGQNMVLFLGAMMSVDSELYEAAAIDGANGWHKFRYIMLPSIKSIVVLNLILSISGSLSAFEPPYVITGGSFGTATYFVMMDKLAHVSQKVGLASAMAIILFILIFVLTMLQQFVMDKVFSEEREDKIRKKREKAVERAIKRRGAAK